MGNRIAEAIRGMREALQSTPAAKQETVKRKLDLTLAEFCKYQDEQAMAHAGGKITLEEAQTVYVALGGETFGSDGGWPRETDLATRIVVTKLVHELMSMRREPKTPSRKRAVAP